MVRVATLSDAHEHLHYSARRFRARLLAEILATSNQRTKVQKANYYERKFAVNCKNKVWQNGARKEELIAAVNGIPTTNFEDSNAETVEPRKTDSNNAERTSEKHGNGTLNGCTNHTSESSVKTERISRQPPENEDDSGINKSSIWSPRRKLDRRPSDVVDFASKEPPRDLRSDSGSSTPVIWTPRSAPSSPNSDRKLYKPVKFETSNSRKNFNNSTPSEFRVTPESKQQSESSFKCSSNNSRATTPSSIDRNLPFESLANNCDQNSVQRRDELNKLTATITNNANIINTTASKLPKVQNPTITLLQKAREGQLPRGASYIDSSGDRDIRETNEAKIPNGIARTIQRKHENESNKKPKKMAKLSGRKSNGIGPVANEEIPSSLEIDTDEDSSAKWYKQMYESLHKSCDDHDFVTIRYKCRSRGKGYSSSAGYQSEPEPFSGYNSDMDAFKYHESRHQNDRNKENHFSYGTIPRSSYGAMKHAANVYKNQPGRIEDYQPGHSSIAQKETQQNMNEGNPYAQSRKPFSSLHGSGYDSDSTLVFKRREDNQQTVMSPAEQRSLYKSIQKGGEVPLHGLRKPAPEKPKESPHKYAESEVTLQYKVPIRNEIKEAWSEEELNRRQVETMRRVYQEERRRKYLQELQDMTNRRHTDNFTPSQKSPIPLNRYDDVLEELSSQRSRSRTPEPKLVARALYNFTGQTSRELTFRKGDIIFVKRQIDKNWYEGEHNAMIGLFPINYVEIIPYDEIRTLPKRPSEGQARAKFNFVAQSNLELSLVKGELIVLTRRVDENWYEGRIGNRKGIFPVSYVHVTREPGLIDSTETHSLNGKPVASPAAHSLITNQHALSSHHNYQPNSYTTPVTLPRTTNREPNSLPYSETLHIDTSSEPVPYRALYNYKPQNEDELELREGDTVFVMEKCDDGWYVGSSQRTSHFGTFPGNYVERIS